MSAMLSDDQNQLVLDSLTDLSWDLSVARGWLIEAGLGWSDSAPCVFIVFWKPWASSGMHQ